jgi:hypothetical protein
VTGASNCRLTSVAADKQFSIMRSRIFRACVLSVSMSTAAHAQAGTKRYIAATDATVVTTIEEGYGSTPSAVIYVKNLSTVQVTVYSFALRDCENVRQRCAPTRVDIRVPAGSRAILTHVEPRNPELGYTYRFSFGWRADSSDVEALRLMAEAGSSIAIRQLGARDSTLAERHAEIGRQDLTLDDSALAALGSHIARLRVEPDSVVLRLGQMFLVRQVHVMAVDAQGMLLGRVRAYRWRVMPGVVTVQADTVVGQQIGRTIVEFRLKPPAAPLTGQLTIVVVPDTSNIAELRNHTR